MSREIIFHIFDARYLDDCFHKTLFETFLGRKIVISASEIESIRYEKTLRKIKYISPAVIYGLKS